MPLLISEPKYKMFIDTVIELSESGANFVDDELIDEVVTMIIAVSVTHAIVYMLKVTW